MSDYMALNDAYWIGFGCGALVMAIVIGIVLWWADRRWWH